MPLAPNDPKLRSWVPVPTDSDFPIQNIPFGIGRWNGKRAVPTTRIGQLSVELLRNIDN